MVAWNCRSAEEALRELIGDSSVICEVEGVDRYNQPLGTCKRGELNLSEEMIRRGMAWADRRYSWDYDEAEEEAREQGRGIWAGPADPPWLVRMEGGFGG